MKLSKRDEKLVRPQQRQSMKLVLTKAISALPGPRISISFTVLFSVVLYIYIYIYGIETGKAIASQNSELRYLKSLARIRVHGDCTCVEIKHIPAWWLGRSCRIQSRASAWTLCVSMLLETILTLHVSDLNQVQTFCACFEVWSWWYNPQSTVLYHISVNLEWLSGLTNFLFLLLVCCVYLLRAFLACLWLTVSA